MTEPYNKLTPEQDECLSILAEECAEVIQIVMKIQRHGLDNYHPDDKTQTYNAMLLFKEYGHILAAFRLLTPYLPYSASFVALAVSTNINEKLLAIDKYLHHAKAPPQ